MAKPTILIGHGRFGKEVLQRLLRKTAPRGTLTWEQSPHADSGVGEHRLRDLALLWMPAAALAGGAQDAAPGSAQGEAGDPGLTGLAGADSKADFIVDLYRQIREVEYRPGATERALCDAVAETAAGLRLPETIRRRGDGIGGLDVIIVAHVGGPGVIGSLDLLTKALLKRLVDETPAWRVNLQSARKLNCIQILDFDNFRGPTAETRAIRRALARSMEAWKIQLDDKRPALDRCYLVDGRAQDSHRDRKSRYDEIVLFLELLLFSGLRDDDRLKDLYQQGSQDQQIAAAFGVRLMERSPQLLSRVAAARFGEGWLPYLRGGGNTRFMRPAHRVAAALSPIVAKAQTAQEGQAPIAAQWDRAVAALAEDLSALPGRESDDWPSRAQDLFAQRARMIELELQRAAFDQLRRLRETHLRSDGQALAEEVTRDLHHEMEPVPLAAVLEAIDAAIRDLEQPDDATVGPPGDPVRGLAAADAIHRTYLAQRDEWVADCGRGLARFWPLVAAVAGLAATPFVRDLIRALPAFATPQSPLQQRLIDLVALLDRPTLVAPVLFLLTWLVLRTALQPRITHGIQRARDFHLDALHGRLSDAIQADCESLRGLLERVLANIRATLAADLLQVLTGIRERLARRGRELDWLRGQLGEFLRMQGLHAGAQRIAPPDDSVHMLVQGDDDLAQMMRVRPALPAQFECRQEARPAPFDGWNQHYCDAFLDLFAFVDALSRPYLDKFQHDLGIDPGGPEWLLRRRALREFIAQPGFELGFKVDADKNASGEETYCVMPASWSGQQEVRDRLAEVGPTGERIRVGSDESRVYLLKCQFNIGLAALEPSR